MKRLLAAAVVLALGAEAARACETSVTLSPAGPGGYKVHASLIVPRVSTAAAWGVLSDYDGIDGFVSSMKESRVVERREGRVVVAQKGTGRFFFFRKSIQVVLEIREIWGSAIDFRDVDGKQFAVYEGGWRLEPDPSGAGAIVRYSLTAQPRRGVPALVERAAVRRNIERMLVEVGREIERRSEES